MNAVRRGWFGAGLFVVLGFAVVGIRALQADPRGGSMHEAVSQKGVEKGVDGALLSGDEIVKRIGLVAPQALEAPRCQELLRAIDKLERTPESLDALNSMGGSGDAAMGSGAAGQTIMCRILDSTGALTTTVVTSVVGDKLYWFDYLSGGAPTDLVSMYAFPLFQGSPLRAIVHYYAPESSASFVSPFGVPFWGGDLTSGIWVLLVINDTQDLAWCFFEVVPD